MKMFLTISLMCAASAAFAKPDLPAERYQTLAEHWFATEQCAIQGQLSAETAAYGKQILREVHAQYEMSMERFDKELETMQKTYSKPPTSVCNSIAMTVADIRLQRSTAAAQAQSRGEQEQQQRQAAQIEAQRQQQEAAANAASKRDQAQQMTEQFNQIGQQFRSFGNSVQPRTTNCVRTFMGANCTSY